MTLLEARALTLAKQAEVERLEAALKEASTAHWEARREEERLALVMEVGGYSDALKALLRELPTCPQGQQGANLRQKGLADRYTICGSPSYIWSNKAKKAQEILSAEAPAPGGLFEKGRGAP